MKEAIRLLGTIVFFFGSLQGVTQSTASRSQEVASHAGQAEEFLKEQWPDLAIPEFRAIVGLDPNNVDARGNLGVLLLHYKQTSYIRGLIKSRQQQIESHSRKAAEYLKESKPELAAPEFRAIVALDPNNVDARGNLGVLLFFQGAYADAIPQPPAGISRVPEARPACGSSCTQSR